jgi:phosphate transport system permease protein
MRSIFSLADKNEKTNLVKRYRVGKVWHAVFFLSTAIGLVALVTLLLSIVNQSFGLMAVEYKVDPATLANRPLEELSDTELIDILKSNVSKIRLRTLEKEKPLEQRLHDELLELVNAQVVGQRIVNTWNLYDSIFRRSEIEAEAAKDYPNARLEFRAWLNWQFLKNTMSSQAQFAGIRTALLGSLNLILYTILFALPIGIGAAIYLEEYARKDLWFNRVIQTNIDNLAGVPSIVYGILGLAIFVRALQPLTSGALFGTPAENGRTMLSAGLTMALLVLPIIIINAQEAIRAVPDTLRQASYGLGATKWQTIWSHVLPYALPGILTGTILAISRAIGETAPLILVGASTYITTDPSGPFSHFTALPIQIYNWTTRAQGEFRSIAAAAIIVLMTTLLMINASAILLRNRYSKKI